MGVLALLTRLARPVVAAEAAMVAVAMNGEPLPAQHGFPARLVVPGLYGYVSATKWLAALELRDWDFQGYWVPRGWAKEAPVKTQSRIDVPRSTPPWPPTARPATRSSACASRTPDRERVDRGATLPDVTSSRLGPQPVGGARTRLLRERELGRMFTGHAVSTAGERRARASAPSLSPCCDVRRLGTAT